MAANPASCSFCNTGKNECAYLLIGDGDGAICDVCLVSAAKVYGERLAGIIEYESWHDAHE